MKLKPASLLVALSLTILATAVISAQDGLQTVAVQKKKRRKLRGRLPNYYGKAGVTKTQRKQIYAIQAMYRDRLQALQDQIDELKAKQAAEIEAVLTDAQKKKVKAFVEAARKKREARKKKRDKEKEEREEKKKDK